MGLQRFATDIFNATKGNKHKMVVGSASSGFDLLGSARAVASQLHPLAGGVNDIVSIGENLNGINNGVDIHQVGKNLVGGIQSGLSAVGGLGGLLGAKGAAGAASVAGPASLLLGTSMAISEPAVKAMRDPKVRNADINAYRQAFGK